MTEPIRHADFPSRFVRPRHVEVWLPPGYVSDSGRRYPVIYMHDGQNLFNPADANFGVTWAVAEAITRLASAGEVSPAIVVGLWSTPLRYAEYRPQRPFDHLSRMTRERLLAPMGGALLSDNYLSFIVNEVKPVIDTTYRTLPDRLHTSVMGSSMGGLISLYASCEYPDIFGGAGCVSSHWPSVEGVIVPYLEDHVPDPATHRIYFDYGTHTLDTLYAPGQAVVDEVMREMGYIEGVNWLTRRFPGAAHFERDWAARVEDPLRFLLADA